MHEKKGNIEDIIIIESRSAGIRFHRNFQYRETYLRIKYVLLLVFVDITLPIFYFAIIILPHNLLGKVKDNLPHTKLHNIMPPFGYFS